MAFFVNFIGILENLGNMGFFTFVLPWLLFLILLQAILKEVNMFQLGAQKSTLLAAIISFFIVNFTTIGVDIGTFLTKFFGVMSMYLTAVLVFILFLGMGGWKLDSIPGGKGTYMLVFFLIAVIIFANVSPMGIPFLDLSTENLTLIFIIALIAGVVGVLSKEEKPSGKPPGQ